MLTAMPEQSVPAERPPAGPAGRAARGRPRVTPHPTATLLLETAVELLEEFPIDALTTAMVLERSGVAYGSLYHHYADVSDLVEQAVVERYTRRLKESVEAVRTLLDAPDRIEFERRAELLFTLSISSERRQNRLERVEVFGALPGRPRLVERLARAQQEITDAQAAIFMELRQRGWVRADLDPVALSAFIQAMILGRVVDDVTEHPVSTEQWNEVAIQAFRSISFLR